MFVKLIPTVLSSQVWSNKNAEAWMAGEKSRLSPMETSKPMQKIMAEAGQSESSKLLSAPR
eukprot:3107821-Amphidinium_carterae.1